MPKLASTPPHTRSATFTVRASSVQNASYPQITLITISCSQAMTRVPSHPFRRDLVHARVPTLATHRRDYYSAKSCGLSTWSSLTRARSIGSVIAVCTRCGGGHPLWFGLRQSIGKCDKPAHASGSVVGVFLAWLLQSFEQL